MKTYMTLSLVVVAVLFVASCTNDPDTTQSVLDGEEVTPHSGDSAVETKAVTDEGRVKVTPHFDDSAVETKAVTHEGRVYVKADAVGNGSGASWRNACTTFQDAFSKEGIVEVWIAKGDYRIDGSIFVPESCQVIGGFEGSEHEKGAVNPVYAFTFLGTFHIAPNATISGFIANMRSVKTEGGVPHLDFTDSCSFAGGEEGGTVSLSLAAIEGNPATEVTGAADGWLINGRIFGVSMRDCGSGQLLAGGQERVLKE